MALALSVASLTTETQALRVDAALRAARAAKYAGGFADVLMAHLPPLLEWELARLLWTLDLDELAELTDHSMTEWLVLPDAALRAFVEEGRNPWQE
jgi:hypothetical protein